MERLPIAIEAVFEACRKNCFDPGETTPMISAAASASGAALLPRVAGAHAVMPQSPPPPPEGSAISSPPPTATLAPSATESMSWLVSVANEHADVWQQVAPEDVAIAAFDCSVETPPFDLGSKDRRHFSLRRGMLPIVLTVLVTNSQKIFPNQKLSSRLRRAVLGSLKTAFSVCFSNIVEFGEEEMANFDAILSMVLVCEDQDVVDDAVSLLDDVIQTIGISVLCCKKLLGVLRLDRRWKIWPRHASRIVSMLTGAIKSAPTCVMDFAGNDSGLEIVNLGAWPFAKGFAFATWLRWEPPPSPSDLPRLFRLNAADSGALCLEAYLSPTELVVSSNKGGISNSRPKTSFRVSLPRNEWAHIVVVHNHRRGPLARSDVSLYVNGALVASNELSYPQAADNLRLFVGAPGNNVRMAGVGFVQKEGCSISGQMTHVLVYNDVLSTSDVQVLYSAGNSVQRCDIDPLNRALVAISPADLLSPPSSSLDGVSGSMRRLGRLRIGGKSSLKDAIIAMGGPSALLPLVAPFPSPVGPQLAPQPPLPLHPTPPPADTSIGSLLTIIPPSPPEPDGSSIISQVFLLLAAGIEGAGEASARQLATAENLQCIAMVLEEVAGQRLTASVIASLLHLVDVAAKMSSVMFDIEGNIYRHLLFNMDIWIYAPPGVQCRLLAHLAHRASLNPKYLLGIVGSNWILTVLRRHFYSDETSDVPLESVTQATNHRKSMQIKSDAPKEEESAAAADIRIPNVKLDKAGTVLGERPKEPELRQLRRLAVHVACQLVSQGVTPVDINAIVSTIQASTDIAVRGALLDLMVFIVGPVSPWRMSVTPSLNIASWQTVLLHYIMQTKRIEQLTHVSTGNDRVIALAALCSFLVDSPPKVSAAFDNSGGFEVLRMCLEGDMSQAQNKTIYHLLRDVAIGRKLSVSVRSDNVDVFVEQFSVVSALSGNESIYNVAALFLAVRLARNGPGLLRGLVLHEISTLVNSASQNRQALTQKEGWASFLLNLLLPFSSTENDVELLRTPSSFEGLTAAVSNIFSNVVRDGINIKGGWVNVKNVLLAIDASDIDVTLKLDLFRNVFNAVAEEFQSQIAIIKNWTSLAIARENLSVVIYLSKLFAFHAHPRPFVEDLGGKSKRSSRTSRTSRGSNKSSAANASSSSTTAAAPAVNLYEMDMDSVPTTTTEEKKEEDKKEDQQEEGDENEDDEDEEEEEDEDGFAVISVPKKQILDMSEGGGGLDDGAVPIDDDMMDEVSGKSKGREVWDDMESLARQVAGSNISKLSQLGETVISKVGQHGGSSSVRDKERVAVEAVGKISPSAAWLVAKAISSVDTEISSAAQSLKQYASQGVESLQSFSQTVQTPHAQSQSHSISDPISSASSAALAAAVSDSLLLSSPLAASSACISLRRDEHGEWEDMSLVHNLLTAFDAMMALFPNAAPPPPNEPGLGINTALLPDPAALKFIPDKAEVSKALWRLNLVLLTEGTKSPNVFVPAALRLLNPLIWRVSDKDKGGSGGDRENRALNTIRALIAICRSRSIDDNEADSEEVIQSATVAMRQMLVMDCSESQILLTLVDSSGRQVAASGGGVLSGGAGHAEFRKWLFSSQWDDVLAGDKMRWAEAALIAADTIGWSYADMMWGQGNVERPAMSKILHSMSLQARSTSSAAISFAGFGQKEELEHNRVFLQNKRNSLLLARRTWRSTLRTYLSSRALFGKGAAPSSYRLSTQVSANHPEKTMFWKLDKKESAAKMRRRLKRDFEGSTYAECAYASTHTTQRAERESTEAVKAMIERVGSMRLKPVNSNKQDDGDDGGSDEEDYKAVDEANEVDDASRDAMNKNNREEEEEEEEEGGMDGPETWADVEEGGGANEGGGAAVAAGGVYTHSRAKKTEDTHVLFTCDGCEMITPSLSEGVKGTLVLSSTALSFTPRLGAQASDSLRKKHRWEMEDLVEIHGRRYLLQASAIELFFVGSSVFFHFSDYNTADNMRRTLYKKILALHPPNLKRHYLRNPAKAFAQSGLTEKWIKREISNFEYLMQINSFGGRTYNDLMQYHVFPWVLADYTSSSIDLSNPAVYRDLTKPMGAQTKECEKFFRDRYRGWEDPVIPKFHYGSHYTNAGFVLWYLLRLQHYTSSALVLQDGHFDCPDRMFHSVQDAWRNAATKFEDVKEMIPEFYYLPEFLMNHNRLTLGTRQDGTPIDDVVLPPWAENADDFVRTMRDALESEYVSNNLHAWIDLIFGYKQRGPKAEEACNVFFYLTYEGAVDLRTITDPVLRRSNEAQIANFGQTPSQLLTSPHPPRSKSPSIPAAIHSPAALAPFVVKMPPGLSSITHLSLLGHGGMITVHLNGDLHQHLIRFDTPDSKGLPFVFDFDGFKSIAGPRTRLVQLLGRGGEENVAFHAPLPFLKDTSLQHRFCTLQKPSRLVTGGHLDGSIRVTPIGKNTGRHKVLTLRGHSSVVKSVGVGEKGTTLVSGAVDGTVRFWKLTLRRKELLLSTSCIVLPACHDAQVTCVTVNDDLDLCVTSSSDGTFCFWSLDPPKFVHSVHAPDGVGASVMCISAPTGRIFSYSAEARALYSHNVNGRHLRSTSVEEVIHAMICADDGKILVLGGSWGVISIRNANSLEQVRVFEGLPTPVWSLALDPTNNYLIAGCEDGQLRVFSDPARTAVLVRQVFQTDFGLE